MDTNKLKVIALKIKALGEEVRSHLGCGFNEVIFQNALAIEFRKNKIEYLKEVNIEIFFVKLHGLACLAGMPRHLFIPDSVAAPLPAH